MLFGVLYFVFTQVVKFGEGVDHYPVYLLSSVVLFTFLSESTTRGVLSLVERENLLRKIRFPRLVIPCSIVVHSLFNLGLNLVVVFVFVLASGIEPRLAWLELIPLVGLLVVLGTGLTMLLSALYVRYRDVQPIWEVVLQILFYGSPIFYVIDAMPDSIEEIAAVSPIALVLTQMRHALIDPSAPTAAQSMSGDAMILVSLAIVAAVLVLGLWVFARETPHLAENL
jgi:ABC-2 type transport system permease protein